ARFTYLKGDGVLLEFALIQYALQTVAKHGFTPVITPHMVKPEVMRAMGYLEHGGHDEIYYLSKDNMYLIGTSEQSVGAMHMDEILDGAKLPIRYVGFSPCYRREAGSYGKDTKGILRVHQFDKVEMFSFSTPENSDAEHNLILEIEETLMQGLKIPYRVIKMVTGDLGLPAARKYDIEAWMPSQKVYRETHSCSSCTDFQARRLNTRYKIGDGKPQLVHTLNGTTFAIGRTLIAILENFQQEDGSVIVPEVLRPFMGGKDRLIPTV
ncbi:serine--tRNA ligase, partial [Patescibacteria group bacterium]|nr:serine--tRNA ligase [Patescibacteria group bacterium]